MIYFADPSNSFVIEYGQDADQAAFLARAADRPLYRTAENVMTVDPLRLVPVPPDAVLLNPPQSLADYAAEVGTRVENGGTTWNGWPVKTNGEAQRMSLGELSAIALGVREDGEFWGFADGVARPLTNDQMKALATAIRAHVKAAHGAYMQAMAGIMASPPSITTTDQVDAAFASVA